MPEIAQKQGSVVANVPSAEEYAQRNDALNAIEHVSDLTRRSTRRRVSGEQS